MLLADTRVEDPDLWRFVHDSTVLIGVEPTVVADGRTPFEVFRDHRFLGNSRLAPCSAILKQRPARAWLNEYADPADAILYVGIDWSETRRIPAIERGWAPWIVRFPMCDPPHLSKQDMLAAARAAGLEPPRLYALGFSHNNFYRITGARSSLFMISFCTLGIDWTETRHNPAIEHGWTSRPVRPRG